MQIQKTISPFDYVHRCDDLYGSLVEKVKRDNPELCVEGDHETGNHTFGEYANGFKEILKTRSYQISMALSALIPSASIAIGLYFDIPIKEGLGLLSYGIFPSLGFGSALLSTAHHLDEIVGDNAKMRRGSEIANKAIDLYKERTGRMPP